MSKIESITKEQIAALPPEVRTAVVKWAEQGRDPEHVYGVVNFFTGIGAKLIAEYLVYITCTCGHSWVTHQHPEADYYCDAKGCECGAYELATQKNNRRANE